MGSLNEWHDQNWKRMATGTFGEPHSEVALLVCIGEELGELCSAMLGVTGEKKRKAHLTHADVTDACADAATYLSLLLRAQGNRDLERLDKVTGPPDAGLERTAFLFEQLGGLVFCSRVQTNVCRYAENMWAILRGIAAHHGRPDWHRLLGETFNMVSDRAGSPIKTTLGQP
jgi:hypothetical protein